jgi:IclR family acetate operon transcriptional repressor
VYYHPNAYGKAIMAFMPEEEIKAILPPKLPALTPRTITLLRELLPQLEETRRTGLAYDNEEYTSGIVCIGSPVFDVQGKIAAGLGITAIASLLDEKQKTAFAQLVLECAFKVSKAIGYSGDFFRNKLKK